MDHPRNPQYVNFGLTARYFVNDRPPLPPEYYDRLQQHGVGLPGQRMADLGCGSGLVSLELARRGCSVDGVDVSSELLSEARRLADEAGLADRLAFHEASAESTGLPAASYDAVTAATCWHYFDHDRALEEVRRILRPGGRLAASWFHWLPLPGSITEATEQLVLKYNPDWKYGGILGIGDQQVTRFTCGMSEVETYSFDRPVEFSHEAWRLRQRSCGGIGAALEPDAIEAFDAELARLLTGWDDPLSVLHRNFVIVCSA